MSTAWLFQDHRQRAKLGDKCPWSVGFVDPDGKRKSKKVGSKSLAEKVRKRIEAALLTGTYESESKPRTWEAFRAEYESKVLASRAAGTVLVSGTALDHFERIAKPGRMSVIRTKTVDDYIAARRKEKFAAAKRPIAPATINRELRTLRAAFRCAVRWDYMKVAPQITFEREPEKIPRYVTPEQFGKLYEACETMAEPAGEGRASDWWRAILIFAFMTGWRIGQIVALRWEDVDLAEGIATSRATDNKGKRDQAIALHPLVVEHLAKLDRTGATVFGASWGRRMLWVWFASLQKMAGVIGDGDEPYGFHDLRRAFATLNADRMSPQALQSLMQHRSYETTRLYINMARQLRPAAANIFVPSIGGDREAKPQ